MLKFVSNSVVFNPIHFNILQTLSPIVSYHMYSHFSSTPKHETKVGIFWDLNNTPPKSISLYDTAIGITKAASAFGFIKYTDAFGDVNWLSSVTEDRVMNRLGNVTTVVKSGPSICEVCGRRFYNSTKFVNHFKKVHEAEHIKMLNQIESARGKTRVKLVGKYSVKMYNYKNAVRDILNPKVGNTLSDDLSRAGFWVMAIPPRRVRGNVLRIEMRKRILEVIKSRQVQCVVIVSDDSYFVDVLKEEKSRRVKTVVFGDSEDGELKKIADAAFSWEEIIMGKVQNQAVGRL